jgi:uncharacterized small protein (DUF1192 family)
MAIFDEEPKKKPRPHEIGQDLSLLSVDELSERIALLREEISSRGAVPARITRDRSTPAAEKPE